MTLARRPDVTTDHEVLPQQDDSPRVGEWYWVKGGTHRGDDGEPARDPDWFGCVTHVGSNYALVASALKHRAYASDERRCRTSVRVHVDRLDERLTRVLDPEPLIAERLAGAQARVATLLGRVKQLTDSLAVTPAGQLQRSTVEGAALALRDPARSFAGYTAALVKAKAETLPALFAEVKEAHEEMADWLSAPVLPLKAQGAGLDRLVKAIDDRVFYDATRSLTTGEAPDWHVYRASLNRFLAPGCVTVGQERAWLRAEGKKQYEREGRSSYGREARRHRDHEFYRPDGDPGPGQFARLLRLDRQGHAHYGWEVKREGYKVTREYEVGVGTWERKRWTDWKVPRTFRCDVDGRDSLLCADAYTPGDFHLFFDDPRTRADYIEWAPLLLACEEYRAGNREVGAPGGHW